MNRTINRLKIVFLVVFIVASALSVAYHVGWVLPRQACESKGDWWDSDGRVCAHPVLISDITGRVAGDPPKPAPAAATKPETAKAAATKP